MALRFPLRSEFMEPFRSKSSTSSLGSWKTWYGNNLLTASAASANGVSTSGFSAAVWSAAMRWATLRDDVAQPLA